MYMIFIVYHGRDIELARVEKPLVNKIIKKLQKKHPNSEFGFKPIKNISDTP